MTRRGGDAESSAHDLRESDVLARLGGDEFVALAMFSPEEPDDVIETRLHQTLAEHNARPARRYAVSISTVPRDSTRETCSRWRADGDRGRRAVEKKRARKQGERG